MAKRNKTLLLDFAQDYKISFTSSGHKTSEISYIGYRNGKGWGECDSSSNEEFEKFVINEICVWKDYIQCPEFQLLEGFFKAGNNFEKVSSLYDRLDVLKIHAHGKGAQLIYTYCRNVLKGRLPEHLEKIYLRGLWGSYRGDSAAYKYAKYVVRGRLDSESEVGCNNLNYINFLLSKNIEIDEVLMGNTNLSFYFYRVNWYLPDNVHNFMIASHLAGDRIANSYFKQRKKDDRMILNRLKVMDQTKTIKEIVENLK